MCRRKDVRYEDRQELHCYVETYRLAVRTRLLDRLCKLMQMETDGRRGSDSLVWVNGRRPACLRSKAGPNLITSPGPPPRRVARPQGSEHKKGAPYAPLFCV